MFNKIFFQYLIKYLVTFALLSTGMGVHAEAPENYPFVSYDAALRAAKTSGKKIFIYYGRFGCGYCDKTNKESFSNNKIRKRYTENYELAYIDAEGGRRLTLPSGERITEQQFGPLNKIIGTPYFLYLGSDGSLIYKAPGFKTVNDFIQLDDYVTGQHYKTQSFAEFTKGASS